jgi:hypothetical protein
LTTREELRSSRRSQARGKLHIVPHEFRRWSGRIIAAWRSSAIRRQQTPADADFHNGPSADYALGDVLAVPDLLAYAWRREQ